jgi:4-methoxybenzoate monooxygenase (O-demethylating)
MSLSMTNASGISAPVSGLDIFDPAFAADPYPHYARLREMGPVAFLEKAGLWVVARHADVKAVLSDHETFSSAGGAGIVNIFKEPPRRPPGLLLEVDPPVHTRTRGVIQRILSGPALRKLREAFFAEADALIEPLVEKRTFDAVKDVAEKFPPRVFPVALGLDLVEDEREKLLHYGAINFAQFGPQDDYYHRTMQRAPEILPWIAAKCRREALTPDGFGGQVYAAVDDGRISEDEAPLLVRSFLAAGLDTTIAGLGRVLRLLATHPIQWRLVADNPELSRGAFEEMMRYDHPSIGIFRTTSRACTFEGVALPAHEKVLALTGSANRDPGHWVEPDTYDIRRVTIGHMGFGSGIHACVGMMVARLEGEAILTALAKRAATLDLAAPVVTGRGASLRRAFASVPVRVTRK